MAHTQYSRPYRDRGKDEIVKDGPKARRCEKPPRKLILPKTNGPKNIHSNVDQRNPPQKTKHTKEHLEMGPFWTPEKPTTPRNQAF